MIIEILISATAGYIWANQILPLEDLKYKIGLGQERTLYFKNNVMDKLLSYVHHFLNCHCISFWICLYLTSSIGLSLIAYALGAYITQKLNTISL